MAPNEVVIKKVEVVNMTIQTGYSGRLYNLSRFLDIVI